MFSVADFLSDDDKNETIMSVFQRRKKSFLDSLQKILTSTGNDRFIIQMFEDPNSAMFVPDRVCELIERYLTNERENYINELYQRIRTYEACFGVKKSKQIENIGTQILQQMEIKNPIPPNNPEIIKKLRQNLNILNSDSKSTIVRNEQVKELKSQINALKGIIKNSNLTIRSIKDEYARNLYQVKHLLSISVESMLQETSGKAISAVSGYKEMEKKFKLENAKLQTKYQNEIEEHIQNEQNYEKEIRKLKSKLEQFSQQTDQQQTEITKLKGQISQLESKSEAHEDLNNQKIVLENEISRLRSDLRTKDMQIQKLVDAHANKTELDTSLQAALAKSRLINTKRGAQIQKLKDALKSLSIEYENVSHELSLAKADSQLTDARLNKVNSLEQDRQKYLDRITELEGERDSIERKFVDAQNESQILKEDNERMRRLMKDSSMSNLKTGQLVSVIDQLNAKINEGNAKILSQEDYIENLKLQNDSLKMKISAQEQKTQSANSQIEQLRKELDDANRDLTEQQKSISLLNSSSKKSDNQVLDLKSRVVQADRRAAELSHELQRTQEVKQETDRKLLEANDSINELKTKNSMLEDEVGQLKDELSQKNAVLKDFLSADETQKSQNSKLMNEYVLLQRTAGSINAELRGAQRNLKSKEQELQIAKQNVENLKSRLKSKEELAKQLKSNLDETSRRLNTILSQQKSLEATVDEMRTENLSLRDKIGEVNTSTNNLQEQLQIESQEKDKMRRDIRDMKERQMLDIAKYEKKIDELRAENSSLQKRKGEDQNTIEKQQFTISKLEKEVKQKEDELQFEKDRYAREMKRKDELIDFEREKNEKSLSRSQEILDIEKLRASQENQRILQAKESEIAALKKRLGDTEKHVSELEGVIKDGSDKIQAHLTDVIDKNNALKTEKSKLSADLQKANSMISTIGSIVKTKQTENLPTKVDEIRRKAEENEEVNKLFGFAAGSDFIDNMRSVKKAMKTLTDRNTALLSLFPESNESNIIDQIKTYKKAVDDVNQIVKSPSIEDIAGNVNDVVTKINNATKLMGVAKSDDLTFSIKNMIKSAKELEKTNQKMLDAAGVANFDEYKAKIKSLREDEEKLNRIMPGSKDPVSELIAMKGKHDQICGILGGVDKAEEAAQSFAVIKPKFDELAKILGGDKDRLIYRAKELTEAEPYKNKFVEIARKLGGEENVKKSVDELIELKELTEKIPGGGVKAIDKLKNLMTEHRKLEEQSSQILDIVFNPYGNDISKAVENLKNDLKSAAELFERLMGVLSGAEKPPFKFKFPLEDEVRDNLIVLIGQFKVETEETTSRINAILGEARKDGYVGTNILEAVEFISHARMDEARDEATKAFSAEMASLRENYDIIVKKSDDEHHKYVRKIEEISNQMDQQKAASLEKEKDFLIKIEKANKLTRNATSQLDKEKKIKEELLRVISNKPSDSEFLRANLSAAEFRVIQSNQRTG